MNAHLITLLNVAGIAKRNDRLPLAIAGKVNANNLMSRLVCPLNQELRPFVVRPSCHKLVRRLCRYVFSFCQQPASMKPP